MTLSRRNDIDPTERINVWIESNVEFYRVCLWGVITEYSHEQRLHPSDDGFKMGYVSGVTRLEETLVPWIAKRPGYMISDYPNGYWTHEHSKQYHVRSISRTGLSWHYPAWAKETIESKLLEFPRVLRINNAGRKRSHFGRYMFHQDISVGPHFKGYANPDSNFQIYDWKTTIWVGGRVVLKVPLDWLTPDMRWKDSQGEYLAREAIEEFKRG